jgi:uncharacterized protein YkwD
MSRLRLVLPALALALVLALPAGASAAACKGGGLHPTARNMPAVRAATLCLLNRQRARHGLPKLRQHRVLRKVAARYSRQMVRQGFFAHVSPSGSTMVGRIRRTSYLKGVRAWSVGENLAWGAGRSATPARIVRAWMRSPGHRRNILDGSYREIGIGIVRGAPRRAGAARAAATYTTEFGRRRR